MSTQLIINETQLPVMNVPADVLEKLRSKFSAAAASYTTSFPRLSFGGKAFNISFGGETIELPERVLDVHLVAVDTRHHYTFFERAYTGTDSDKGMKILSRYPLSSDPIEFKPDGEWAQRAYKKRAIVMLANDPTHKLYIADFGYNTDKKSGNHALCLFNLGQVTNQLDLLAKRNPNLLQSMFTVQLSFTKSSVPEIQFSLHDQRQQGGGEIRFATPAAIDAMISAEVNGELDTLMKAGITDPSTPALEAPVTQTPVTQTPVTQTPVVDELMTL